MSDRFSDAARSLPHRTEPRPLHFPVEEKVPESAIHLQLRTFLFLLMEYILEGRAIIGSDHFVYFDAGDPRRCVAPDVFVKWGADPSGEPVTSWKIWERGVPELCVEIDSPDDESTWGRRLANYRSLGVRELVRFDADAEGGKRIRVWDRIDEDFVERTVEDDTTPCLMLGMHWVVRAIAKAPVALRLAHDAAGEHLVATRIEASEAERANAERGREVEQRARVAAEARIAELEDELRRRTRDESKQ